MHVGVVMQSSRRGRYSSLEDAVQHVAKLTPSEQRNLETALREVREREGDIGEQDTVFYALMYVL